MKIKRHRVWPVLISVLLISISVQAHKDRLITLENECLVGLPNEYQPAQLNLNEGRLRIKNHVMVFPPYIRSLFPENRYHLEITSSWYHERSILPPYLSIHIIPDGKDFSYEMLFNMDTLEIIKIEVVIHEAGNTNIRDFPVALSDQQKNAIKESVSKVRD